ncbi:MAG: glycosyltransferase family 4 protein [Armatimonadetes bacterium]|nr:glycosyltransferase family 4 protein [Armatimonadota bacterium]
MNRVFVWSTLDTPFIRDDVELLGKHYAVEWKTASGFRALPIIFRGVRNSDVSISWFGSVYAVVMIFVARLLGRRSVVIIGGVDTARDPENRYGVWLSWWKRALLGWGLPRADHILAVAEPLAAELRQRVGRPLPQLETLPTGYDPNRWKPDGHPNATTVLCVAHCDSRQRLAIKGIDLLLLAATQLPELQFQIIGIPPAVQSLVPTIPANVTLLPPIPRNQLLPHYQRALIFCQPSRREGLPNTLCEAMLCGCIPVGADVGGIADAIGESGFVTSPGNAEELRQAIAAAAQLPPQSGLQARERVIAKFSQAQRESRLVQIINHGKR